MTRLRQAKDEAEREVTNYRSYMDTEYQNKISEVISAKTSSSSSSYHLLNI